MPQMGVSGRLRAKKTRGTHGCRGGERAEGRDGAYLQGESEQGEHGDSALLFRFRKGNGKKRVVPTGDKTALRMSKRGGENQSAEDPRARASRQER